MPALVLIWLPVACRTTAEEQPPEPELDISGADHDCVQSCMRMQNTCFFQERLTHNMDRGNWSGSWKFGKPRCQEQFEQCSLGCPGAKMVTRSGSRRAVGSGRADAKWETVPVSEPAGRETVRRGETQDGGASPMPVAGRCTTAEIIDMHEAGMSASAIDSACLAP